MKKFFDYVPGILLSVLIAAISVFIEKLMPIHLIGAAVIAIFIGIVINYFWTPDDKISKGLKFTSKRILKFSIILLGASLNISVILNIGKMSLLVMVFTLLTCFGGGYFIGKALGLNWKLSNLISAGTGICGGSAIAAIAPTIDADDRDIAYAMSATFIFDMAMIILFPIIGDAMNLTDVAYGLWTGTAVNDTSSVVAAGYGYSEAAGDFATMVKLTRTLVIIPTVIIFALINIHIKKKSVTSSASNNTIHTNLTIAKIIPWFILGFIALAVINSTIGFSDNIASALKSTSKFLMVAALAAIGLNTSFKDMRSSGFRPMLHGFIISALVVIVAIAVEYVMHLSGTLELFKNI